MYCPLLRRAFNCEDCALHCSAIFHYFIRVDGPVGSSSLKNSWIADCTLGLQVEFPTRSSHARSSARHLCLAGTSHEAFGLTEWAMQNSLKRAGNEHD